VVNEARADLLSAEDGDKALALGRTCLFSRKVWDRESYVRIKSYDHENPHNRLPSWIGSRGRLRRLVAIMHPACSADRETVALVRLGSHILLALASRRA